MAKAWIQWSRWFLGAAVAVAGLLFAFVAALDPFGMRVHAGQAPQPIMDINQRFMYPQLVRSGRFDAAVVGTSTMRLLDPQVLSRGLDARFANLAMNAATPWEQTQMAQLFRTHVAAPKRLIWGIDTTWCEADATDEGKRLTPVPTSKVETQELAALAQPPAESVVEKPVRKPRTRKAAAPVAAAEPAAKPAARKAAAPKAAAATPAKPKAAAKPKAPAKPKAVEAKPTETTAKSAASKPKAAAKPKATKPKAQEKPTS